MSKVLVINAGSSSMKWALFNEDNLKQIASGIAERIGIDGRLNMSFQNNKFEKNVDMKNHLDSVGAIIDLWKENKVIESLEEIKLIGFRVVHGGEYFKKSEKISDKEIELIDECSKFAPLHNPGAVQAIKSFKKMLPNAKLSANFDTAFHGTLPEENYMYSLNYDLSKKYNIRKYGFHGISHRYITLKLQEVLGKEKVNFVNMHLGNGSSLAAIKNSESIDTTMGFTPLAGVMMGTRSGDIDPSIHEFVAKEEKITIEEFTNILNKQSGLLGISGVSSDMRDIDAEIKKGNHRAKLALDLFGKYIADYCSSYMNKIGPNIDALVFTAGIGENAAVARKAIIDRINILNVKLDPNLNERSPKDIGEVELISTKDSVVPVYIIRTNEELMIAKDAIKLNK